MNLLQRSVNRFGVSRSLFSFAFRPFSVKTLRCAELGSLERKLRRAEDKSGRFPPGLALGLRFHRLERRRAMHRRCERKFRFQ